MPACGLITCGIFCVVVILIVDFADYDSVRVVRGAGPLDYRKRAPITVPLRLLRSTHDDSLPFAVSYRCHLPS